MELEELALLTLEEIEKEVNRRYPDPADPTDEEARHQAEEERMQLRENICRLQMAALFDGKLTIEQVVERNHVPIDEPDSDMDFDDIHRNLLKQALEELKEGGKSREQVIDEYAMSLL